MADTTPAPAAPQWSRWHRFMVGDRVAITHDEHDELGVYDEGVVTGWGNAERTYLKVRLDDKTEVVLTEDEVRRVPD